MQTEIGNHISNSVSSNLIFNMFEEARVFWSTDIKQRICSGSASECIKFSFFFLLFFVFSSRGPTLPSNMFNYNDLMIILLKYFEIVEIQNVWFQDIPVQSQHFISLICILCPKMLKFILFLNIQKILCLKRRYSEFLLYDLFNIPPSL